MCARWRRPATHSVVSARRRAPRARRRWRTRAGHAWATRVRDRRHDGAVMAEPKRIVIAAGGTAGHVVPALAVADALRADGAQVSFVGGDRAEAQLVPAA